MIRQRGRERGISMIEIVITLAVIAILASVAAPAMVSMMASQRVKAGASDLFSTLVRARSEAIKRNADVTVAPAGESWADGWTIANPADGDAPLEVHGALSDMVVTGPDELVYTPSGRLRTSSAPEFSFSAEASSKERCVAIDLSGRPNMKHESC